MSERIDLKRSPVETLGQLVTWLVRPGKDRFAYWRTLFTGKRWALILITYGKPGEPQDPPHEPTGKTSDRQVTVVRRHRSDAPGRAGETQEGSP